MARFAKVGFGTCLALFATAAIAQEGSRPSPIRGPSQSGDDTLAFQAAIAELQPGDALRVPAGHYTVHGTLVVNKPIAILGAGLGTQIYEAGNQTLFQFTNVSGMVVRDVYLGSNATYAGTSLLELINSHRNEIQNVTMLGGYYGLHLAGSLLNTFIDLRTGINIGGFFANVSNNNTWVKAEPANGISANANTFVAPVLEGGKNGIALLDGRGQGSLQVVGGTIEGVGGVALAMQGTFLPSSFTGVHFESNVQDIVISGSSNIKISAVYSVNTHPGASSEISVTGDSRNVQISDSVIESLLVDSSARRILLRNVTFGTAYCPNTLLNLPPVKATTFNLGTVPDPVANITAANVGNYCNGQ